MNINDARDAIYGIFFVQWDSNWPVVWGDLPATPPTEDTAWARVKLQHTFGQQATLAGETGTRRFDRRGVVTISIFVPVGGGQTKAYELAQMVANAYEDAKLDVWFRNTRIREMGASGAFEQMDVLSNFHYDEVR